MLLFFAQRKEARHNYSLKLTAAASRLLQGNSRAALPAA